MSYRRRILREVLAFWESHPGGGDFILVDTLACFTRLPLKKKGEFMLELNQLLQEGWLLGAKGPRAEDPELAGRPRVSVKVNPDRVEEIRRELRFDWKWVIGTIIAFIALIVAFLAWIKPFAPK